MAEGKIVSTFFKGMNLDSKPFFQPQGTYREAWNAIHETDEYRDFGLVNEQSTTLARQFGGDLVGYHRLEESNQSVVFVYDGASKIYLFNHDTFEKTFVAADSEFGCDWGFSQCAWIGEGHVISKYMTDGCKELHIYWSSDDTYWTANITALLDPERRTCYTECEDFLMFKCKCGPRMSFSVNERGGDDLPPGAIYFAAKLKDGDGGDTNWFFIEGPVLLGSENNLSSEKSPNSVLIQLDSLDPHYNRVEIAAFPSVNGIIADSGFKILSRSYNTNGISFDYYSTGQHIGTISLAEVITKRNTYLRGKNIGQKDGRAFIYRTLPNRNLDYQRRANGIQMRYVMYAVPAQEAWRFKGFMRDEVYAFGIQWKYCDGTYSPVFHIPGVGGKGPVTCDCTDENNASRTETICTFEDIVDAYCVQPSAYLTQNELDAEGPPPDFCTEIITRTTELEIDPDDEDCVDHTTTREQIEDAVDNWKTDNDSINDCVDCNDADTDDDLTGTENVARRLLETLRDLFRTDKEVADDCSIDSTASLKEAAQALYNEAIKEAELDEEGFLGSSFEKVGGSDTAEGIVFRSGTSSGDPQGNVELTCLPTPIYDESCRLIGYEPSIIARGEMGGWESEEVYPFTKDCDGEYIYGALAGKPIRHHRMPDVAEEPVFISYQTGVESNSEPENKPDNDTFVFFVGVEVDGIIFPSESELNKPLCQHDPYRILYVKRERHNRSVQQKGYFVHTFEGKIGGKTYAVPKNGVNGPETIDGNLNNDGDRRGEQWDKNIYTFNSPETCINSKQTLADYVKIDKEIYGGGMRYGLWAEGEEPEEREVQRKDRRGARSAVNLNHYSVREDETTCVTGISYADADTNGKNPAGIEFPLLNKDRESTIFLQTEDAFGALENSGKNGTTDLSFIGDGLDHATPIARASAWYGALKVKNSRQYGNLESVKYADLGLSGRMGQTKISGCVGDSYIQKWSNVRKSLVSDKVGDYLNEDYPVTATEEYLGSPDARKRSVCDPPNRRGYRMKEYLGFWHSTSLPESGDKKHPKNMSNLHPTKTSVVAMEADGPETDIYYWRTQSTLVHLWVETDVNLHYRTTGDVDLREVYYENLKGLEVDSSINGALPKDSFLNDFHAEQKQPSARQKALKARIRVFITTILPAILMGGIAAIDSSMDAATTLFTAPFFITLWQLLVYNIFTNKKIEQTYGFPICKRDEEGATNERNLRGFRDNYCKYNLAYSAVNDINDFYGMPDPYNVCICPPGETTNEIYYSNKQILGSYVDAYKNFRANNFLEVPADSGDLMVLFEWNNRFYAHTTDGVYLIQYANTTVPTNNGFTFLGSGDLLADPQRLLQGIPQGYAGTEDPNSAINTPFGRFFVDHEAKKLYLFNGELLDITGESSGMKNFFREHIPFCSNLCRDQLHPSGMHYALGYDHRHNRLLFTKNDGEYSFTASYDPIRKVWVSFHDYIPQFYMWDRGQMFSATDGGIWLHDNNPSSYQTFYGTYYPHSIEVPIHLDSDKNFWSFRYNNTILDTEANKLSGKSSQPDLLDRPVTFTHFLYHNQFQTTGLEKLAHRDWNNRQQSASKQKGEIELLRRDLFWRLNGVKNFVSSEDLPIFTKEACKVKKVFSATADHNKVWNTQNSVFGKYGVYLFIFDTFADTQLITKRVITNVELPDEILE